MKILIQYLLIILSSVAYPFAGYAQYYINENKVWVFGDRAGLDFNNPVPQPIRTALQNPTGSGLWESSASVCDSYGRLLFYTNGEKVWERLHNLMPNGNPLAPVSPMPIVASSSQGAVILPVIDTPGKYYILAVTCWEQKRYTPPYDGRLFYSVVDMSMNINRGDVASYGKWVQADSGLTEMVIAVPGNKNNIWIITHANYTNQFRVWELTASGFSASPQIYSVGISGNKPYIAVPNPPGYANSWWSFGQMAIAPDRTKLAVGYSRANYAELYDFDPCTGAISNPVIIDSIRQANATTYFTHTGLAFSPNSRLLYVAGIMEDFAFTDDRFLYQFDISTPTRAAIAASKTQLGVSGNTKLRLAPNRKIYSINADSMISRYLDVVEAPDVPDTACQFRMKVVTLDGRADIGLGNDFVKPLTEPTDTIWSKRIDTALCHFPESGIPISAPDGYDDYQWEDGSTSQVRYIDSPGTYFVFYSDDCDFMADSFRFTGTSLPDFRISGPDSVICSADTVLLDIPVDDVSYTWQNGAKTRTLKVTTSGRYIATISRDICSVSDTIDIRFADWKKNPVTQHLYCQHEDIDLRLFSGTQAPPGTEIVWNDGSGDIYKPVYDTGTYSVIVTIGGCVFYDTFSVAREICFCEPVIPTAFTPNGDGRNDIFRSLLPVDCPIGNFTLRIFDRWGTQVFHTTDPSAGWDGYHNGVLSEAGTYMYHVRMTSGTRSADYDIKGDLTLLR